MKILLTGASGQIGGELAGKLRDMGTLIAPPRDQMNLADPGQIRHTIRAIHPDIIINAAAYTDVEQAEAEPALAMQINGEAPAVIAQEARRLGAALVHYSTDYVFDGRQSEPYNETAPPNPLNAYGRSKLAGEQGIIRHCETYWILRCSWVYSARGKNFLKTMWRLLQERDELQVVADQTGAPTWARSIAAATADMLAATINRSPQDKFRTTTGIYHLAASGTTSWHGMALSVLRRMQEAGIPARVKENALLAVTTAAYPTAARRPLTSTMDTGKWRDAFQLTFPHWQDDLYRCMEEMIARYDDQSEQPNS